MFRLNVLNTDDAPRRPPPRKNSFERRNYIRAVAYRVAALKAEDKRAMAENPRWISATEYSPCPLPCPLPVARRQPIRVSVQPCSLTLAKTVLDRITEPARRSPATTPSVQQFSLRPFAAAFSTGFHGLSLFFLSFAPAPQKSRVHHDVGSDFSPSWHPFVG